MCLSRFADIYETLSTQRFAVDPDPYNSDFIKLLKPKNHAIQKGNLRIFVLNVLYMFSFGPNFRLFFILIGLTEKNLFLVALPKRGGKKNIF